MEPDIQLDLNVWRR